MKLFLLTLLAILLMVNAIIWIIPDSIAEPDSLMTYIKKSAEKPVQIFPTLSPTQTPIPTPTLLPPPPAKTLQNNYFVIQSFNNCGPASLSMMLSYFGINETQQKLGQDLRPFQNPSGDNDDKSVTLDELAKKAQEYGLIAYHLPNGNIDLIKQFITYDIPVLTRTWLGPNEDIGHYRIVKGYDDNQQVLIQDDSYQGKNLSFPYNEFNIMWEKFNYEYVVLVPQDKKQIAEAIIDENLNQEFAWRQALKRNEEKLLQNPSDIYATFNIAIASYYLKNYQRAVQEYEKIQTQLPFRTLWYQREPIEAYYHLGNYDKVFSITNEVLNNYNRAYSELYILRGKIYEKQGNTEAARQEYEKAVFYNTNLKEAKDSLNSLNTTATIDNAN